ncbi:hypothetical protein PspLS_03731 [Pyricularia sp. CBS 133598]|nr:hypothetical protein PspLS_03731 [Pyricularia sp. CBS 133598]
MLCTALEQTALIQQRPTVLETASFPSNRHLQLGVLGVRARLMYVMGARRRPGTLATQEGEEKKGGQKQVHDTGLEALTNQGEQQSARICRPMAAKGDQGRSGPNKRFLHPESLPDVGTKVEEVDEYSKEGGNTTSFCDVAIPPRIIIIAPSLGINLMPIGLESESPCPCIYHLSFCVLFRSG